MCHCRLLLWCRFKARKGVNGLAGPGALARRDWLSGATRERRCSYAQCPQTSANTRWHLVTPYTNAGGRDWSEMVGQTLCSCCFQQFRLKAPHTHTHTHTLTVRPRVEPPSTFFPLSYRFCRTLGLSELRGYVEC